MTRPAPKPLPRVSDDLADLAEAQEREAAARRRAGSIHDSETRKRTGLAAELLAELRRPLVEKARA